jgi:hypothetical protein
MIIFLLRDGNGITENTYYTVQYFTRGWIHKAFASVCTNHRFSV